MINATTESLTNLYKKTNKRIIIFTEIVYNGKKKMAVELGVRRWVRDFQGEKWENIVRAEWIIYVRWDQEGSMAL